MFLLQILVAENRHVVVHTLYDTKEEAERELNLIKMHVEEEEDNYPKFLYEVSEVRG